jgi:hypothetical protein
LGIIIPGGQNWTTVTSSPTRVEIDTESSWKSKQSSTSIKGDILRQLKLYSEYVKGSWLVLVSTVPLSNLEHQALSNEGVVVVVLGEAFERWKASRMSEVAVGIWEV